MTDDCHLRLLCAGAACALALSGCAGNGMGLDLSGRPLPPGGTTGGVLTADFDSIQANVFTPVCTVCHAGAGAPQGLRLDSANSYALLVGVPSTEVPSILRVKAGDPDNSYLIEKLEGHAAVGAQMPFGEPPLPAATIAVIRQWISDGALRPAAAAMPAAREAFAAVAIVPAPGEVLTVAPVRIVVAFNAELDGTRIDGSSVRLERIGTGTEDPSGEVPVAVAAPAGNPRALLVTPLVPLGDGRYRLVAAAPPDTGLASIGGARLGAATAANALGFVMTTFEVAGVP